MLLAVCNTAWSHQLLRLADRREPEAIDQPGVYRRAAGTGVHDKGEWTPSLDAHVDQHRNLAMLITHGRRDSFRTPAKPMHTTATRARVGQREWQKWHHLPRRLSPGSHSGALGGHAGATTSAKQNQRQRAQRAHADHTEHATQRIGGDSGSFP